MFVRESVYCCTFSVKSVTVSIGISQHDIINQLPSLPNSHMSFVSPLRHDASCHLPFGFECHIASHLLSLQLVDVFKTHCYRDECATRLVLYPDDQVRFVVYYVP